MHVNKVHHVTTITRVAEDLGESEDWLCDVANEMEIEDGVIWVYGVGEDGVMAFTDFGIENLIELIKMHKDNPAQLKLPDAQNQVCLQCHAPNSAFGPRGATFEEHTQHKAGSPGSLCIECHMPKIQTTIATVNVRAHTFAFITPAMTDQYKIPNPCTSCHTDKTTAWATDALRHWPNRSPWRVE